MLQKSWIVINKIKSRYGGQDGGNMHTLIGTENTNTFEYERIGLKLLSLAQKLEDEGYEHHAINVYMKSIHYLEKCLNESDKAYFERRSILERLYKCYQKLCVETSLPEYMQTGVADKDWLYYVSRAKEIHDELTRTDIH